MSSQGAMDNRCVITAQNSKPLVLGSTNPEFPTCLAYEATFPDHASPAYFWDLMYLFDSFHHRRSKSALFINDIQCLAQEGEIQRHARTNRLGAISESLKNMLVFVFSTPRNNTPPVHSSLCVCSPRGQMLCQQMWLQASLYYDTSWLWLTQPRLRRNKCKACHVSELFALNGWIIVM